MSTAFIVMGILLLIAMAAFVAGHIFSLFRSPFRRITNWADIACGICAVVMVTSGFGALVSALAGLVLLL